MISADMLWDYTIEENIDDSTKLIKNDYTKEYFILKILPAQSFYVLSEIAQINSPYLMKIYSIKTDNDICYSICEYVNGLTLEDIVEKQGVFKEKKAVAVMNAVSDGLSALHGKGIIHKDIKPSNVMIDFDGNVKIVDFGISRIEKENQNKDTEMLGTVGYASPEHFGFIQSDKRADIYSCGVLLNYLLTGKLPHQQIYDGYLKRVIEKCTALDRENRYQNTDDFKIGLKGKLMPDEKRFRPLPGFRGKHVFPKILMVIVYMIYILMFSYMVYAIIVQDPGIASTPFIYQIYNFLIFFVFFTLLPYLLFGDVGQFSRKINPTNPKNGKYVLNAFGVISFIIGFVLLFMQI